MEAPILGVQLAAALLARDDRLYVRNLVPSVVVLAQAVRRRRFNLVVVLSNRPIRRRIKAHTLTAHRVKSFVRLIVVVSNLELTAHIHLLVMHYQLIVATILVLNVFLMPLVMIATGLVHR